MNFNPSYFVNQFQCVYIGFKFPGEIRITDIDILDGEILGLAICMSNLSVGQLD